MPDEDKQIDIKKRARRRLVGAAALALLAAIILPMVMDSEPRSQGNDIQIRIPPQSGDNAMAKEIAARPAAVIAPPPPEATPEPVASPRAAAASDKSAADKPTAERPVPPEATLTPDKASADERRPAAILAGQMPTAAGSGQFVVQLGAYRDKSNAVSLQNKLRSEGFSSYTEKAGDKTRVRVGPFADRAAADTAAGRLKSLGLGGAVVPRD